MIFRATGKVPTAEVDPRHWRATARVGDQLLSIALFGPRNGRTVSGEGRTVLRSLVDRTRAAN